MAAVAVVDDGEWSLNWQTVLLMFIICLAPGTLWGQQETTSPAELSGYEQLEPPSVVWQRANLYYQDAEFEKALSGYLYLQAQGIRNGYLFYNIGNTYFALGNLGKAILWYERAHRYLPRFEDLNVNLEYARSQMVDEQLQVEEPGGTIGLLAAFYDWFTLREFLFLTLASLWLFCGLMALRIWVSFPLVRNSLRIPCWLAGLLFIIFCLFSAVRYYDFAIQQEAVIVAPAVEVKTSPGEDFATAFSLHEGTKVRILQQEDDWVRVELPAKD